MFPCSLFPVFCTPHFGRGSHSAGTGIAPQLRRPTLNYVTTWPYPLRVERLRFFAGGRAEERTWVGITEGGGGGRRAETVTRSRADIYMEVQGPASRCFNTNAIPSPTQQTGSKVGLSTHPPHMRRLVLKNGTRCLLLYAIPQRTLHAVVDFYGAAQHLFSSPSVKPRYLRDEGFSPQVLVLSI